MRVQLACWTALLFVWPALHGAQPLQAAEESDIAEDIPSYENFIRYNPNDARCRDTFDAIVELATASPRNPSYAEYAHLADITGAMFDDKKGRLILWGPQIEESAGGYMPPFLMVDDFVMALKILDAGEYPQMSIGTFRQRVPTAEEMEQVRRSGKMPVEYIPDFTAHTHAGFLLFEADRWLKTLGLGRDSLTYEPAECPVRGYRAMSDLANVDKFDTSGKITPFGLNWFLPDAPQVATSGYTMKFVGYKMRVKYLALVDDPAIARFANHMTDHFDEYLKHYPVFRELVRFHKLTQVARWYRQCGFPYKRLLKNYQPLPIKTLETTRMIQAQIRDTNGYLAGGVNFSAPNYYVAPSSVPVQYLGAPATPTWQAPPAISYSAPAAYGSYSGPAPVPTYVAPLLSAEPATSTYSWTVEVDNQVVMVVALPVGKERDAAGFDFDGVPRAPMMPAPPAPPPAPRAAPAPSTSSWSLPKAPVFRVPAAPSAPPAPKPDSGKSLSHNELPAQDDSVRAARIVEWEQLIRRDPRNPLAPAAFRSIVDAATAPRRDKSYAAFASLADIEGVTFDEKRGELLVWGPAAKEGESGFTPPFLFRDEFVAALSALEARSYPAVAIGPASRAAFEEQAQEIGRTRRLSVDYRPDVIATSHAGRILFEADRRLKSFALGKDMVTGEEVVCPVSRWRALPQRISAVSDNNAGQPKAIGILGLGPDSPQVAVDGYSMKFVAFKMRVRHEALVDGPAVAAFAKEVTEDFEEYTKHYSIFRELVRLAKTIQVANWYRQCGFPSQNLLDAYVPLRFQPVSSVNLTTARIGNAEVYVAGAVDLSPGARYASDTSCAFPAELLAAQPTAGCHAWTGRVNGRTLAAIAIPVADPQPPRRFPGATGKAIGRG